MVFFFLILNLGKSRFSTTHAFEIGTSDRCNGEKMRKYTSFDVVLVDEQTAFHKVNVCDLPSSFNLSASILVTKVESDPLSLKHHRLTHKFVKPAGK